MAARRSAVRRSAVHLVAAHRLTARRLELQQSPLLCKTEVHEKHEIEVNALFARTVGHGPPWVRGVRCMKGTERTWSWIINLHGLRMIAIIT